MGLKDLLKNSIEKAPRKGGGKAGPRLHVIDMTSKKYTNGNGESIPTNQGTIKFIPILGIDGKELKYAYDVKEYLYQTPPNEEGNSWNISARYMDPNDYQMALTDEDKAEILRARSLVDDFADKVNAFPDAVTKDYALIFGYVLEHVSITHEVITDKESRKMALLIFPSKNFAKAMTTCLESINLLGDDMAAAMYSGLFSRETKRKVYLQVDFSLGSGFGYDTVIQFKPLDSWSINMLKPEEIKTQEIEIPQEEIDFCGSISAIFFAGNHEGVEQFNTTGEFLIPDDFDSDYTKKVTAQMMTIINDVEKAKNAAENLAPIPPSKNRKKPSDLDKE